MLTKNTISNPLICKVEFSFLEDILSMEAVDLHQVKITMQTNKLFVPMYGTPASYSFNEPADHSSSGLLYKQKLSVYYPGVNDNVQPDIIALDRKQAVVKIHYTNGLIQVMGSLDVPAIIVSSFNSSDATGYSVIFTCDMDERARFLIIE